MWIPAWLSARGNLLVVLGTLLLAISLACSTTTPAPAAGVAAGESSPLPGGPQFSAILVTSDLAVGANRVSFGLIDRDGMPVRTDEAQVQSVYFAPGDNQGQVKQTVIAEFREWPPTGTRGVFVTNLEFDVAGEGTTASPGYWELKITATTGEGVAVEAQTAVRVAARSSTPGIGELVPRSVTPTGRDTDDLSTISSANPPDPSLYQLSIDQALDQGKPLVVVFASPAFCVSATCGPQVEMVSQVQERHQGEANFIHVEVFENPHLMQGGRPSGGWVATVDEWGMLSEPWTFVIDGDGRLHAKFEQFVPAAEIEAALREVL